MKERVKLDIEKFVQFHKSRIVLLNEYEKNKSHGRLIFQVAFLGFESLAKLLYLKENDSGKRFKSLLTVPNIGIDRKKVDELYIWRNALIHEGFIAYPWTTLEAWGDDDISFLSYPDNKLRSSVEYPPGSIIAIYKNLIEHVEEHFKRTNIREIEFTFDLP